MNSFIKKYYKLISNKIFIYLVTGSLFLAFFALFLNKILTFFLMIPIIFFVLSNLIIMLGATFYLTSSKERMKLLKNLNPNKDEIFSFKDFCRKLKIDPHTAYAITSLLERTNSISFIYKKNGKDLETKPKNNYSLYLKFHLR